MPQGQNKTPLFGRSQRGGIFAIVNETMTTGNIFFVDSGSATGADSVGAGRNPDVPFLTIDFAIGQCTASNGDFIFVMPGHAETVVAAAGLDFDVAGITVVGLGSGTAMPTITLNALTTATVEIGAVDVVLKNLRFVSDINDLAILLDVNFGTFQVIDCDFLSSSAKECFCFIDIATTKDDILIKGCRFFQPTDPAGTTNAASTGCIFLVDSQDVIIDDCYFSGFFESSIIHNRTTAATRLWIRDCYGTQELLGAEILTLVANGTGGMADCKWAVTTATDMTTAALFVVIGAASPFGLHDTTFSNDHGGGENLALPVVVAMT
jgi:hypothetical protein